jgi:hypothetical protein
VPVMAGSVRITPVRTFVAQLVDLEAVRTTAELGVVALAGIVAAFLGAPAGEGVCGGVGGDGGGGPAFWCWTLALFSH